MLPNGYIMQRVSVVQVKNKFSIFVSTWLYSVQQIAIAEMVVFIITVFSFANCAFVFVSYIMNTKRYRYPGMYVQ